MVNVYSMRSCDTFIDVLTVERQAVKGSLQRRHSTSLHKAKGFSFQPLSAQEPYRRQPTRSDIRWTIQSFAHDTNAHATHKLLR